MEEYTIDDLKNMGISAETRGGLPVICIRNDYAETKISSYGAHVLSYIPKGEKDLLWISGKSWWEQGKPIRGGIPVCWPWFGSAGAPAHGIARISNWKLDSARPEADGSTTLEFALDADNMYSLDARLTVNAGAELSVSLRTSNRGFKPFTLSEALHTYFSISDIANVKVCGLEYDDLPDEARPFPGFRNGELYFEQETDLVCQPGKKILVVEDSGWNRKIRIQRTGSHSAVVWNPWIAKSRRMEDFGDEEYRSMLCVEAANAREGSRVLIPGSVHTVGTRISLI